MEEVNKLGLASGEGSLCSCPHMCLGNYLFHFILFDSFHLSLTQHVLSSVLSFQKLIENFQLQSQSIKPPLPLAELQSRMDMLQVSQQTVEGAT